VKLENILDIHKLESLQHQSQSTKINCALNVIIMCLKITHVKV